MSMSSPLIWFLIGVVFLVAELFLPGLILIFFTGGCWIVAILDLFYINFGPSFYIEKIWYQNI